MAAVAEKAEVGYTLNSKHGTKLLSEAMFKRIYDEDAEDFETLRIYKDKNSAEASARMLTKAISTASTEKYPSIEITIKHIPDYASYYMDIYTLKTNGDCRDEDDWDFVGQASFYDLEHFDHYFNQILPNVDLKDMSKRSELALYVTDKFTDINDMPYPAMKG